MSDYRLVRVTGPQQPDGTWPGCGVRCVAREGTSRLDDVPGEIVVLPGNGRRPAEGHVYAGTGVGFVVVVNPVEDGEGTGA